MPATGSPPVTLRRKFHDDAHAQRRQRGGVELLRRVEVGDAEADVIDLDGHGVLRFFAALQ